MAVEVAAPGGLGDRGCRELAVDERSAGAGLLVVQRGDEQAEAGDLAQPALGREVAERAGADDAARAGAVEMNGLLAGDAGDGVARLEDG